MLKNFIMLLSFALPWNARRRLLEKQFGYSIHPTSRIGFAWIAPRRLVLEENARIGHLTFCKNIDLLHLGVGAVIGQLNWITGFPTGPSRHFAHQPHRQPELILEAHAGVSSRHLFDCTSRVRIGTFATIGGFRSQFLTHSIDLAEGRQSSEPIDIGDHCFVGTDSVLLGGSVLPHHSVLGAKSLLNKKHDVPFRLYAGIPAKAVKELQEDLRYFSRTEGFVW
ncbi:MAG: acyltransferase [Verrucomicrobiota bacterium]|nr:acyltransferase [Verrucomicrobiota bacterium]